MQHLFAWIRVTSIHTLPGSIRTSAADSRAQAQPEGSSSCMMTAYRRVLHEHSVIIVAIALDTGTGRMALHVLGLTC